MKSLLLLIAVAFAAAQYESWIKNSAYEPGTEYVYMYESQVLTGVPHHGVEHAGLKLKATVLMHVTAGNSVTMKLAEDTMLYKIQTTIRKPGLETEMLSGVGTPIKGIVMRKMKEELTKPFQFTFSNGRVEDLKMDPKEPTWSANMKKGILETLKVNMERTNKVEEALNEEWKAGVPDIYEDFFTRTQTEDVFRVMEAGVSGECETVYAVRPSESRQTIKVTKVKNFNKCRKSPVLEQGMFSGLTINPKAFSTRDIVTKACHADIELIGTRGTFVVKKVKQHSRYMLTPMKEKHGSAVASITQELTLLETRPVSTAITVRTPLRLRTKGLIYEFHKKSPFDKPMVLEFERMNFEMEVQDSSDEFKITKINELLNEAVTLIHPYTSAEEEISSSNIPQPEEAIEKIRKIECILRTMSVEDIKRLCETYINRATKGASHEIKKKGEILLDVIPTITHPKVVPVVAHLITKRLISTTRAIITMKMVAMTVTPDIETVLYIRPSNTEFGAHPTVRTNPILERSIAITCGTIVRRFITHMENVGVPHSSIIPKLRPLINEAYARLKSERDPLTKVAIIKAFANTGMPSFIPLLKEIAKDKTSTVKLRTNALFGLSKMPHTYKPKLESIISSVYMDMTETPEIRITAFNALMDCKPGPATLHLIARVQRKERSLQVGSLVYSYMSTIAKADLPGMRNLSAEVRKVIPLVRPIAPNTLKHAKGIYMDYLCPYADMGTALEIFKSNGPRDILPSELTVRLGLHALGKTFKALSAGVYATGVTPVLNKILGSHRSFMGSWSEKPLKEMIKTLLLPLKSGNVNLGTIATEIKNIVENLGIVDRPALEEMNVGMYINLLGNDITLLDITAKDIIRMIETGEVPMLGNVRELMEEITTTGKRLDILKVLNLGTSSIEIPTPAGMPVFVNVTATSLAHIHGFVSMQGTRMMDMVNYKLFGNLPTDAGIKANLKPSMAVDITACMGVSAGHVSSGVAVKVKHTSFLPSKVEVTLNTMTGKLMTAIKLPTRKIAAVKCSVRPEVFVITADPTESILNKEIERTALTNPFDRETVEVTIPVPISIINTKFEIKSRMPRTLPSFKPYSYLWTKKDSVITMEQTAGTPIRVEVQLSSRLTNYRTIDRSSMLLEDITINSMITEPRVVKAAISIGTTGGQKATAAMTLVMSRDLWVHQLNTRVVIPSYRHAPISAQLFINLNAITSHPSIMKTLSPSTTAAEMQVSTGSGTTFKIKIEPHNANPVAWNKWTRNVFYDTIKAITGEEVTVSKVEALRTTPHTVTYRIKCDGTNVNWHKFETITASLVTLVAFNAGIPNILGIPIVDIKDAPSPTSGIQGLFTVVPKFRKAVAVVRTPTGKQCSIELPLYLWNPWYKTISLETPILSGEGYLPEEIETSDWMRIPEKYRPEGLPDSITIPEKYWNEDMIDSLRIPERYPIEMEFGACAVHRPTGLDMDAVTTFDSMTYTFPRLPSSCEVVLAKDCSTLSLFTVLMTPVADTKILKVLIPGKKIEIEPVTKWLSSTTQVIVKINGERITVPEDEITTITDMGRIIGEVMKDSRWTTVRITSVGVIVSTDGKKVVVKTNPLMRGYTCGLCGNYNDERMDDLEGPDMEYSPNNRVLISKYVVPSAACPISSVRTKYSIRDIEDEPCSTEERTEVIVRSGQTCFSTSSVTKCPAGCRPTGSVRMVPTPFSCRSTNNPDTRSYLDDAKIRILDELEMETVDTTVPVEVPTRCVRE